MRLGFAGVSVLLVTVVTVNLERLIYVDDSGRPQSGLVVYAWVAFHPGHWATVLRAWLDLRKMLWREFGVPVSRELHTTEYVNGRSRVSRHVPDRHLHGGVAFWKDFGVEVAVKCLEALRSTEGLEVGAVWRRGSPADLARTRREAYGALVTRFEAELAATDSLGMVFMDGDGSDGSYRATHRSLKLAQRRVIEDVVFLDSQGSQLVQMADLVAWTAYVHLERPPSNKYAWPWYTTYLAGRDRRREPQQV